MPIVQANDIEVSRFSSDGLAGWEPRSFTGLTDYRLITENEQVVIQATSRASASGLIKNIRFDPARYRYLRWSWKIAHTIEGGNENTKEGDDYAARVYVIFPGRFFWQTRAINYIWANRLKKGEYLPNAYTANAMMVAVESGAANAGRWVYEERDLLADYRRLFGAEPGSASAIAIMTDTDNTGSDVVAWYGHITLTSERPSL